VDIVRVLGDLDLHPIPAASTPTHTRATPVPGLRHRPASRIAATYMSATRAMPARPARATCAAPRAEPAFLEIGLAEGEGVLVVLAEVNEVVEEPVAVGK
jgi:hypothetical protein